MRRLAVVFSFSSATHISLGAILQQCPWTNGVASCNSRVDFARFPTHGIAVNNRLLKATHANGAAGKIKKMTIHLKRPLCRPGAPSGSPSCRSFKVVLESSTGRCSRDSGQWRVNSHVQYDSPRCVFLAQRSQYFTQPKTDFNSETVFPFRKSRQTNMRTLDEETTYVIVVYLKHRFENKDKISFWYIIYSCPILKRYKLIL